MKTLLVIAGMIAGLSAAHAAERDDLVSVFQAVCMTPGSFSDAMRSFAEAKGWKTQASPNGEVRSVFSKAKIKTGYQPPLDWNYAFHIMWFPAGTPGTVNMIQGQPVEACWVSEPGMKRVKVEARLRAMRNLPQPVRPVSAEVRRWFGKEGPEQGSLEWSLDQQPWDYIVLDESQHMGEKTYLVRLRPSIRKTP
ncbi:hypothetical protein [Microvirga solisilvae]|uniref:hypothetical protein n=1 Tax=Microvirga solisilvae TaxID=2919498 RepID=UPI001FB000AB|nr:hypothetical protein [Microvirga solisilvae]